MDRQSGWLVSLPSPAKKPKCACVERKGQHALKRETESDREGCWIQMASGSRG